MDDEKVDPPRKRMPAASYATTVFQESTIGTVSTFCSTTNKPRKVFKVLAFILCLAGFVYQSEEFLSVVFQYPTTVNLDISRPDILISPAYTFCDNNGINRRIFCEKHPNLCEKPSEELCKKNEYYCGDNNSLVPTQKQHDWDQYTTLANLPLYNVKMEDFVEITKGSNDEENVTGPYLRLADMNRYSLLCYSAFSRVNNSLDLHLVGKNKLFKSTATEFRFNVKSDEMFFPGKRAGILFSIHNPFEAVNPFEGGVFMKPGRDYLIFVTTEEEIMLKEPYDTKCKNYSEVWEKNGRIGPRTQRACIDYCFEKFSMECFHCVAPQIMVETSERICTKDELEDCSSNITDDEMFDTFEKCTENCREDCRKIKFTFTVQERFRPRYDEEGEEVADKDSIINVRIYLEGDEIMVVRHSPKYMIVEVFSSIGGFIGVWLGINLLHILDMFEGIYRVIHYSLKKA